WRPPPGAALRRGAGGAGARGGGPGTPPATGGPPADRDDWRHVGARGEAELAGLFADRFYFGCEADDRTIAFAFSAAIPAGARLRPILSSDLGHWDAGDLDGILPAAWGLVTQGLLDEAQFAELVWRNPARLFLRANPRFFAGTALDGHPLPPEAGKA